MNQPKLSQQALRPFQKRVRNLVIGGRNVVLQAPTGSGKTRAALTPFLLNLARGERKDTQLPRTCRYAVPLRTLADQFYKEYDDYATRLQRVGTRLQERYKYLDVRAIAEQTGTQPNDPQFEAALTFCTIDQLLASFLALPYAVGKTRANLKVGGVVGSYLVLDEWHLYPLRGQAGKGQVAASGARLTSLAMLKLLAERDLCRFVLMTATLSTPLVTELADLLGAGVENLRQGATQNESAEDAFTRELAELHGGRSRRLVRADRPLEESIDAIMERHQDSSLVLCNTVERAQILYWRLLDARSRHGRPDVGIILLHSRFTADDRRQQAELLRHELGKEAWEARNEGKQPLANVIVVATQVVEVGLDISASVLHTELAPANSIVQRAGRCARFAGQQGEVVVYPLVADATYLPYSKDLCLSTFDALPSGPTFGFTEEQTLIDAVHSVQDQDLMEAFHRDRIETNRIIFGSLAGDIKGKAAELIRDVRTLPVLIHDNPDDAITTEPWRWQAFSLHPGTLMSRWDRLQDWKGERDCEWVCKQAIPIKEADPDSREPVKYHWDEVMNPAALNNALMVVLPTALAHYDPDLGFALRDADRFPHLWPLQSGAQRWESKPLPKPEGKHGRPHASVQQSYLEHISGLLGAYQQTLKDDLAWVAMRLEAELSLPPGSVDLAVRVAIACHDIGKLTHGWQRWARVWHTALVDKYGDRHIIDPGRTLLAKTDYDSREQEHRDLQKALGVTRPWHAGEGVALASKLITNIFRNLAADQGIEPKHFAPLVVAVRSAIARHHTSWANENRNATLALGADDAVAQALDLVRPTGAWRYDTATLVRTCSEGSLDRLIQPKAGGDDELRAWLYFVVVRALRLADQRADRFKRDFHLLVPS